MDKKLITLIIPIYNVENYLRRCLDSIFSQGVNNKIEVICINDGSTDNSLAILENYKKNYPEITVVNQANIGLGATRNKGIKMASGKFLLFIDSDDWLEPNCLPKLIEYANTLASDFIEFQTIVRDHQENVKRQFNSFNEEYIDLPLDDYLCNTKKLLITAWSKLWLRDFILTHNILFQENTRWEDIEFSHKAFNEATKVSSIKLNVYNYYLSKKSISRGAYKPDFFNQYLKQLIKRNEYWLIKSQSIMVRELMKQELFDAKKRYVIKLFRGLQNKTIGYKSFFYFLIKLIQGNYDK